MFVKLGCASYSARNIDDREPRVSSTTTKPQFNQPLGGNEMPRFGGPTTMLRLPAAEDAADLDACFVGIPMDIGTSNRAGTRHGPRQIRAESVMVRPYNMATGAAPFEAIQVADIGDVPINTYDLKKSIDIITGHYDAILAHGAIPLTLGGDHTLTWPILRAMKKRHGPVALIHVDAHADINDDHVRARRSPTACPFRARMGGRLPAERQGVPDRAARHRLCAGRFRLGPRQRAGRSCRPRSAGINR